MNIRVAGVTGPPCSGKSLALRLLAEGAVDGRRWEPFPADAAGHAVLERPDVRLRLADKFGKTLLDLDDPAAFRRAVAERVFDRPEDLAWLEGVVHPLVGEEAKRVVARSDGPVAVEAALLLEAGLDGLCDRVLVVEAPFDVRLRRARGRGWSREELERRDRRLAVLFAPERLAELGDKLIRVANDADDGRLAERLKAAWR